MTEVRWRSGSQFSSIDANDAYKELEDIKETNGGVLRPQDVVSRAANKQNPLHTGFEWNDDKAADKWRLHTARNLIRAIQIVRPETRDQQSVSVYHNITKETPDEVEPKKRVYMSIDDILKDPAAREAMLRKSFNEAVNFRKNYFTLSELTPIMTVIEDTISELDPDIDLTLQKASNQ